MHRLKITPHPQSIFCGRLACLTALGLAATLPCVARRTPPPAAPRGSDIMATVDGEPITRRDLTYVWINTDSRAAQRLGDLLVSRWRADGGSAPAYALASNDIYAWLYAGKTGATASYADVLSNLVTSHLLARESQRRGILVTRTEARTEAHRLFDQVRAQRGLKMTDDQLIADFHLPRDIFYDDMIFRLRTEKLIAADIARHNGHPIQTGDWISVRELFAAASSSDGLTAEQKYDAARSRVESWAQEVKSGANMADVAAAHNENGTRNNSGLLNAALRGTGTPSIESVLFSLKPDALSAPLRGRDGWYVFRLERRGDQIDPLVRQAAWEQVVEARRVPFLASLRQSARITSVVPLPVAPQPAAAPSGEMPPAPPAPNR